MKFCPVCGSRLKSIKNGPAICAKCGHADSARKPTLVGSFPFGSMRPLQREVLDQVEVGLASSKFIIFEAPVGFGKSAVAAALCRYVASAYLLTSTKQLQDQYTSDFGFPVVKGKSNFTCCVPTSSGGLVPCSKGRCEVDWELADCPHYLTFDQYDEHAKGMCKKDSKCENLKEEKLCPYYDQKWSSFRAQVTICNYPFFLSELRYTDDIPHRKLLVCDEAHDLEKQMVNFASFALRRATLQQYRDQTGTGPDLVIPDRGIDDAAAWLDVLSDARAMLKEFSAAEMHYELEQDRVAACKATLESLEAFMNELKADPANWVVNGVRKAIDDSVDEVAFQPISVSKYTASLFDTADSILLMSATIFSKEMLCRTLGIAEKDACFIKVSESSFPVDNRRIYALNTAQLNRATMDTALESIARAVDAIMDHHAGQRGVIHTTSYHQVNYIMQHVSESNQMRLVTTEGSRERSTLLQIHGSTDASVLISPSLYQGVDLKDDLSRFQVVVKVPYPDLSERRTRVRLERDKGWYDWQTALRLVQTYGRSVRSESDSATTYVLDSNFTRFLSLNRNLFPQYFLDALSLDERISG
jgi:ATP-dependent DNA helicase DinG